MDLYEALYTTRAMRRVRPDPIPEDVQKRILDAAIRAPTGGNSQAWRFMLIDDPGIKSQLGPLYRECLTQLFETIYKAPLEDAAATPEKPESIQFQKMHRTRAGSSRPSSPWATRPENGAWPRGSPSTASRAATAGTETWASRSRHRCGRSELQAQAGKRPADAWNPALAPNA